MAEPRRGKGSRPAARRGRRRSWWSGPVPWLLGGAGLIVVGAVAAIAYAASAPSRPTAQATPAATPPATAPAAPASPASPDQVGETQPIQEAIHIQPPQRAQYQTDPPSSGPHYSIPGQAPVSWGFSDQQIPPEYYVHNLEHGGVVLLYNCSTDCTADQASVKDFVVH